MIELPDGVVPNAATPALIDFGGTQRPSSGAALLRIDRPGNRYSVQMSLPPKIMEGQGRVIVSRLIRAKSAGLRVPFELAGVDQGLPGAPVVDWAGSNGAAPAGMFLPLRGLTPGYPAKEGFWLSIAEPLPGGGVQHYLHNVAALSVAGADGTAVIALSEMLRAPFPDGAAVHLEKPWIEGMVQGDGRAWEISVDHLVALEFAIEEAA